MSEWLSIAVTFPNGRYHGLEWPPSPARLFQALLAGAMTGRYREKWEEARPILEWLERQPAPVIVAGVAHRAEAYRLAVPNNDLDVAGRQWQKGKPYDASLLRTLKTVRPHEMRGEEGAPHVRYLWAVEDTTQDWVSRLRALADCLHTLGWGIDMAYANTALLQESELRQLPGERWLPGGATGEARKVPLEGSLDDLRAVYERFKNRISASGVDPNTRPTVYGVQSYRREGQGVRPWAGFSLLKRDGSGALAYDGRDTMVVAAWLRHGCAAALAEEGESEDWINRYVHGHDPDGVPGQRMSFVPLPTIAKGHPHTDGRIRRALVTEPVESQGTAVDLLRIKLAGEVITGDGGMGGCQLTRSEGQDSVWELYLRMSRVWRTVTPMVLHGHNSLRGKLSIHKTERLLLEALENSGYPARVVETVTFQPAPLWRGTQAAREIRVPEHLERWPRYHVEVRFRESIGGPVLAGIGRHCGIGVFAAWE
jgi:CRISPR-associated protein Csb2